MAIGETGGHDSHDDGHDAKNDDPVKPHDDHESSDDTTVKKDMPPVTPKELDTFITGLLKDTSEEMTWLRLTRLTKVYKKEAGTGLLEAVFKEIDQMQKDFMPEKLMLPHLEGQFGTNFKALVGSLRPHVKDKGRIVPRWKSRILNTNSADGTEKSNMTPEKQVVMTQEKPPNNQKIEPHDPSHAPQTPPTTPQPSPTAITPASPWSPELHSAYQPHGR